MTSNKKKELRDSPDWERFAGAVLEEVNDKFDAILEQTADIPDVKKDIADVKKILAKWEPDIELIPIIFEEVGKLRHGVETLKEATKLLGRNTEEIEQLTERVATLEKEIAAFRTR